ncbi:guanylate-binding protein 2-like isoform X3 [Hypanus sabinus]|uniref:guanylate-binding protein 2-like isoform X3 n=1 Tax=Hypanus sabinus TaxID=79690 RepID=UPI0028C40303|nr:guanylate-binding protein 2-like isoform X3 [Hypanus sabinus]
MQRSCWQYSTVSQSSATGADILGKDCLMSGTKVHDASKQKMEKPLQLVCNKDGKLHLNPEALNFLQSIEDPMVIVAVVGPARTGKSYLMNCLAVDKKGFSVASTTQAHTKGIWMWCRSLPQRPNEVLLLLDTEGLGDPKKGDIDNDNSIYLLAILLSSILIYNSKNQIDQQSLQDLYFVTELSKRIQMKSQPDGCNGWDFVRFFPEFVWVIRDLTLDLNVDDKDATPNDYLEHILKLKDGRNSSSSRNWRTRIWMRILLRSGRTSSITFTTIRKSRELLGVSWSQAGETMSSTYESLKAKVKKKSQEECDRHLKEVMSSITENLTSGHYLRPGGFQELTKDLDKAIKEYEERTKNEMEGWAVLTHFLAEEKRRRDLVQKMDSRLTEEQKPDSALEQELERMKQEMKMMEQRRKAFEECRNKEIMEQIRKRFEEGKKCSVEELKEAMEHMRSEMEKYEVEGRMEDAQRAQQRYDYLNEKYEGAKKWSFMQFFRENAEIFAALASIAVQIIVSLPRK